MSFVVGVVGWIWTLTTVYGAVVAATLIAILCGDLFVAAVSTDESPGPDVQARRSRRRLALLIASFVAIVVTRLLLILAEH